MTVGHTLDSRTPQTTRPIQVAPRRSTLAASVLRSVRNAFCGIPSAVRELLLVAALYLVYTGSRLLANDGLAPATEHATKLLHVESLTGFDWERAVNGLFTDHDWLGVFGSYWYAAGHYLVTLTVLIWLYRRHRDVYRPARTALAGATFVALICYLAIPTAPPRLLSGFTDVLTVHSDIGWWGAEASAPKGLGSATNQLAAFPSMHAGWALWVGLAVAAATRSALARTLGFAYAAITSLVVIGTANHWTFDVLAGCAIVAIVWFACFRPKHKHRIRLPKSLPRNAVQPLQVSMEQ